MPATATNELALRGRPFRLGQWTTRRRRPVDKMAGGSLLLRTSHDEEGAVAEFREQASETRAQDAA